jgi:hypothetical protein
MDPEQTTITGDLVGDADGEWDEDGFHLRVETDDYDFNFRIFDIPTARKLVRSIQPLDAWIAEHDREHAAYDAATPEERDAVLGKFPEGLAEIWREHADHQRKQQRENQ